MCVIDVIIKSKICETWNVNMRICMFQAREEWKKKIEIYFNFFNNFILISYFAVITFWNFFSFFFLKIWHYEIILPLYDEFLHGKTWKDKRNSCCCCCCIITISCVNVNRRQNQCADKAGGVDALGVICVIIHFLCHPCSINENI